MADASAHLLCRRRRTRRTRCSTSSASSAARRAAGCAGRAKLLQPETQMCIDPGQDVLPPPLAVRRVLRGDQALPVRLLRGRGRQADDQHRGAPLRHLARGGAPRRRSGEAPITERGAATPGAAALGTVATAQRPPLRSGQRRRPLPQHCSAASNGGPTPRPQPARAPTRVPNPNPRWAARSACLHRSRSPPWRAAAQPNPTHRGPGGPEPSPLTPARS